LTWTSRGSPWQFCGMCTGSAATITCCKGTRMPCSRWHGRPTATRSGRRTPHAPAHLGHHVLTIEPFPAHTARQLVSASADKSVGVWDCIKGKRIRKCAGHSGVVNTVAVAGPEGPQIFASGGDDGTLKLWDFRSRNPFQEVNPDCFQILAVDFSLDAGRLFAAGINNSIQVRWRKGWLHALGVA
jgi:WD40 repeat protein